MICDGCEYNLGKCTYNRYCSEKPKIAKIYEQGRIDAIDEYTRKLEELLKYGIFVSRNDLYEDIVHIAEQLKENK